MDDLLQIINIYWLTINRRKNKSDFELNFLGNITQIKNTINLKSEIYLKDMNQIIVSNDNIDDVKLLNLCENMIKRIELVKTILEENGIVCQNINKYYDQFLKLYKMVKTHHLSNNHISLMKVNYGHLINEKSLKINTYIYCLEKWEKDNISLNQDLTDSFERIINSDDFKQLYKAAMKSSYVDSFIKDHKLTEAYNDFMKDYAEQINKYILYVPLTKGIKAYVSNYMRIELNINSIEFIGDFKDNDKNNIYISYLLINLLNESFHFLNRIKRKGKYIKECESSQNQKIDKEIGVDLILHIFGTEYINFISIKNSKLFNKIENWKKNDTNFKVFDKIYLSDGKTTQMEYGLK